MVMTSSKASVSIKAQFICFSIVCKTEGLVAYSREGGYTKVLVM